MQADEARELAQKLAGERCGHLSNPEQRERCEAWYAAQILPDIKAVLARHALEATLAEHKSHIEFESELYAILVDPLAEGDIKEAEMRKALTEAALCSRELANRLNFTDLLKAAQQGLEIWAAKPGNHKWWKRIDGTPIPNDLLVNVVEAIRSLAERASKGANP